MSTKDVLFSFSGRIPRRTWWLWYLVTIVGAMVIMGVAGAVLLPPAHAAASALNSSAASAPAATMSPLFLLIAAVVYIPVLWINLALQAKRWHDRGKSAWWILICLVPFVGGIWALVECGFLRGTVGPNQYGPDPT